MNNFDNENTKGLNMSKEIKNRLADAFRNEDCWTVDMLAKDMGLLPQRARALAKEAIKTKKLQNLLKREGTRVLYPEPFVKKLIQLYEAGELGTPRRRKDAAVNKSDLKSAKAVIQVPLFDSEITDVLLSRFGNEAKIKDFLLDKLFEVANQFLAPLKDAKKQIEEAQRAYEAKKTEIFRGASH